MGNFLLVQLESDLAKFGTTHNAAFLSLQHVNGVNCVVDLRAITAETLCTFLMSDKEFADGLEFIDRKRGTTSPDHIIRAYWKRVRQPRLLND
jgi:hypothetical protein